MTFQAVTFRAITPTYERNRPGLVKWLGNVKHRSTPGHECRFDLEIVGALNQPKALGGGGERLLSARRNKARWKTAFSSPESDWRSCGGLDTRVKNKGTAGGGI